MLNLLVLFIFGIIIYGQFLITKLLFGTSWLGILSLIMFISPFFCERIPSFTVKKIIHKLAYLYMGMQVFLIPISYLSLLITIPNWIYLFLLVYMIIGIYNCLRLVVKEYNVEAPLRARFGLISDVHLGYQIGRKQLQKMIDLINAQTIDFLLIAGDLCDMNYEVVVKQDLFSMLNQLQVPVYMCLGNHDNYTRKVNELKYTLSQTKVVVLEDQMVELNGISLLGRNDAQFSKKTLDDYSFSQYSVVMDHTPSRIQESIDHSIDLHLSGHTHNGQLWPFNFITNTIFKVGYGMKKFGKTNVIVSSGIGYWGPMNKTTCPCELVIINLEGNK